MGTRGAMGVRVDGVDKIAYVHFDSDPSGLGENVVRDVKALLSECGMGGLRSMARELVLIDQRLPPTTEEQDKLAPYTDLGVSNRSETDWYCLTSKLQGKLASTLRVGLMPPANDFLSDSLFCEFAYIVNLDTEKLECYRGFQQEKHDKGRYADLPQDEHNKKRPGKDYEYFPVALVAEFSLYDIPENWAEQAFPEDEE